MSYIREWHGDRMVELMENISNDAKVIISLKQYEEIKELRDMCMQVIKYRREDKAILYTQEYIESSVKGEYGNLGYYHRDYRTDNEKETIKHFIDHINNMQYLCKTALNIIDGLSVMNEKEFKKWKDSKDKTIIRKDLKGAISVSIDEKSGQLSRSNT